MDNQERIRRISVLSRRLRWAIRAGFVFVALAVFVGIIGLGFGVEGTVSLDGRTVPLRDLEAWERIAILAVLSPLIAIAGWLLWLWDRLLALYQRGVVFSGENAAIIRRCGQLIITLAISDVILMPIGGAILSSAGGDGRLEIDPNLGLLLVGVGIIVVGHVMSLGAEIADEASLTV